MEEKPKDIFDAVREVVEATKSFSSEDQKMIIKWACEKLNITGVSSNSGDKLTDRQNPDQIADTRNEHLSQERQKDIKSFISEKKPKSDNHFAAAVAYYYQFEVMGESKKDSINKNDLVDATRLVNWDRLKRPDQTLVNSTKAGLLDNISRGQYRLNSVGENLVAMVLPGGGEEVVRSRVTSKLKTKKKRSKK